MAAKGSRLANLLSGISNKSLSDKTDSKQEDTSKTDSFWTNISSKLKNDTEAIKSMLKDGTIKRSHINELFTRAAGAGNYEITQLCINLGANLRYTNNNQRTALGEARDNKQHHIEQLLNFKLLKANNIGQKINNISNNIDKQNGIINNILNGLSLIGKQSEELFNKILMEVMINIINNKSVFSDDLLNLCWKIAEKENNGDPLKSELWQSLESVCSAIITGKNKRDWYWFKNYLLPSNVCNILSVYI